MSLSRAQGQKIRYLIKKSQQ